MGVLGMSLDDFCALEPSEFEACCDAYHDRMEQAERMEWQRTRMLATITIQPHVKKKLKPRDLIEFPWEKQPAKTQTAPPMTREEQMKRLKRRMG